MKTVNPIYLILLLLTILLPPTNLKADDGICKSVARDFYYAEDSTIDNSYFEKYLIGKKDSVYYIYAEKTLSLDYFRLLNVFTDLKKYAEFMHGYDAIKVEKESESEYLTSIHFIAPIPIFHFESVFTNQVEIQSDLSVHKQCWQQLSEDDDRRLEEFESAPKVNRGYWQLENLGKQGTKLTYHSIIRPPLPLPLWLYSFIIKNSYVDTYKKIVKRVNNK